MLDVETERSVAAVRRFNRFYTRQIGALGEGHLATPFSLTEARVIYELAQRETATATELGQELGLDAGYLSRILRGFQERGLLDRRPSETDARQSRLSLTSEGRAAFAQLNATAHGDVAAMLDAVPLADRARLVAAMGTIEEVLGGRPEPREPYVLRGPRPGDLGWVVQSHGELYAREYGWNEEFEALVAEIVAAYVRDFRPGRERCWISERDGENVGSVFRRPRERPGRQAAPAAGGPPRPRGSGDPSPRLGGTNSLPPFSPWKASEIRSASEPWSNHT